MFELAVVGAGVMCTNHARVATGLRDARVAVIVDPDRARAAPLAASVGAKVAADLDSVLGMVDGVVVAAPNHLHHELAAQCIAAGVPVLVEKPLAPTTESARELVELAELAGVTLAVGHVERFNPAVLELDSLVDEPVHVSAQRISPFSSRVVGDVVFDLMIHDLDIISRLVPAPPVSVQAPGSVVRSDDLDLATAIVTFANGVCATMTASRVGQQKIRQLDITQPDNFVSVDLVRQDVTISRVDHSEFTSASGTRYRQSGVVEIPFLEHRGEPLFLELQDFVDSIVEGRPPRVTGVDGCAAVELATAVRDAARRGAAGPSTRLDSP